MLLEWANELLSKMLEWSGVDTPKTFMTTRARGANKRPFRWPVFFQCFPHLLHER